MARLADGDRAAFDPIYDRLWPILRRFALRALSGSARPPADVAADADDVAQLVLMKVFARASAFDREADALSWILGIAAYECKTQRKQRLRRREDVTFDLSTLADSTTTKTVEETMIAKDLEAAATELLGSLKTVDVETLRAVMEGARPPVPGPTFRKRVERALGRLRSAWRDRHGVD